MCLLCSNWPVAGVGAGAVVSPSTFISSPAVVAEELVAVADETSSGTAGNYCNNNTEKINEYSGSKAYRQVVTDCKVNASLWYHESLLQPFPLCLIVFFCPSLRQESPISLPHSPNSTILLSPMRPLKFEATLITNPWFSVSWRSKAIW